MGNVFGCSSKKSKTKSITNPYLRRVSQIPIYTDVSQTVITAHNYEPHPSRSYEPKVRIPSGNSINSAPTLVSVVLPSVRKTSISTKNYPTSSVPAQQAPQKAIGLPKENYTPTVRTPNEAYTANRFIPSKPIEVSSILPRLPERKISVTSGNSVAIPAISSNAQQKPVARTIITSSTSILPPVSYLNKIETAKTRELPSVNKAKIEPIKSNSQRKSAHSELRLNKVDADRKNVILHAQTIEHPSDLTKSLVNSISGSDDDTDDETFSGPFTFTNKNYLNNTKDNQGNQQSKYHFKQYWPINETRIFFKKNFKNFHVCNSNGYHLIRLTSELQNNSNQLIEQNYLDALVIFADIEDLHCEEAIRVYNKKSEKITKSNKPRTYIIKVPNLIDSRPSISVCSRLMIKTNVLENFKPPHGTISEICPYHIEVEFYDNIDTSIPYDVNFLSNRITFRMEKLAVELMKQKNLVPFMFPKKKDSVYRSGSTSLQFSWFNKSVANNPEQKIVIENIFHGTSYPYPYIVFGPPGTGKTTTLVESILQLWKEKSDSYILVVATSNFACNVISKRLLQFLSKTEIFRLFSQSQEVLVNKIDPEVLDASNLKANKHYSPQPDELYPYRIIVATPTASGRLVLERFKNDHFTHLFIDECASCTEGSSLIPIAGLISSQNKINADIILAGDPLQLRPVIFSKYVEDLGYGVSMMERLMKFPLYQKDEKIGDYNNKYITKLRINYRSHKDILHISNELFYDNELKAMGSKGVTDWIINWQHLPNPKFPIKFQAVFGESLSENGSPSLYNQNEIDVVISHLNLLVNKNINGKKVRQSDIGVITPYRKQNQKIRAQCDYRNWKNVEVATVEAFQGSEKSIIIFSTVRSNLDTMGFLNNERRLNVALTRAKGFLVIIGDPKVLMKDKCWYQLMKYCYDNNAICGEQFNFYD